MNSSELPKRISDLPNSLDQIVEKLYSDGEFSIEFEHKNRKRLKAAFERIFKLVTLQHRRHSGFSYEFRFQVFSWYVFLRDEILGPKDGGYDAARLVMLTTFRHISTYKGEELENGKAKVTFVVRDGKP